MTETHDIDELIADFAFLEDWEDRYMHVIELGKGLAPLSDAERNANTKVKGCVSQVWLVTEVSDEQPPRLFFRGDSDAHIVKGLVAIVLMIFSGRTAQEILEIDARDILARLGLQEHLSPQRANGLMAMIERIKSEAERIQQTRAGV
ncbi:MAG TPA: SufE family protein [Hellea balneolensis]|uniref:SufE family protein n=1 Tax=Hellea balneolensis TaxID=287478 RepID=A0A7V5NWE2_9PROT|nr:SufE family protein [Hellea balneolensis]